MFKWNRPPDNGRGRTKSDAIVITASNSFEGVDKEYAELEQRFGKQNKDWKLLNRTHGDVNGNTLKLFLFRQKHLILKFTLI